MPLTPEEQAERRTGIGGSDVHHLFSLPPYGCRRRLWYEKRGVQPPYPDQDNPAQERGRYLESIVATIYAERTGRELQEIPTILRHPEKPHIMAHLDRLIPALNTDDGDGVLEIKCPGLNKFSEFKQDGLSDVYLMQGQHYLFVTGKTWGSYAIFNAERWKLLWFDYRRNEALIESIEQECDAFWQKDMKSEDGPDRLDFHDDRCKGCPFSRECQGDFLLENIESEDEPEHEMSGELETLVFLREELKGQVKVAENEKNAVEGKIRALMGNSRKAVGGEYRISFNPSVRVTFNSRAFEADHPDLYQQYLKETVTRPMFINPVKK